MKVRITIESTHEFEVEHFDDDTHRYILENYEVAVLPPEYQDIAEYTDGKMDSEIIG